MSYLLAALGLAAGAILALWQRWKLQRALDEVELWRTQAKRTAADLVTASDGTRSMEAACNVLRAELKAQSDYLAALAAAHPDLVGDYVREQLRKASRIAATYPGKQPALPAGPAADAGRGGNRGSGT